MSEDENRIDSESRLTISTDSTVARPKASCLNLWRSAILGQFHMTLQSFFPFRIFFRSCTGQFGQFHHGQLKNVLEFQDKSPTSSAHFITLQECHGAPRSAVSWQMWPTVQSSAGHNSPKGWSQWSSGIYISHPSSISMVSSNKSWKRSLQLVLLTAYNHASVLRNCLRIHLHLMWCKNDMQNEP